VLVIELRVLKIKLVNRVFLRLCNLTIRPISVFKTSSVSLDILVAMVEVVKTK